MQYQIASKSTIYRLEKECQELVSQGWEPQGGISIGEGNIYAQAMIKEDNDDVEGNSATKGIATIFLVFSIINLCIGIFSDNKASLAFSGILIALSIFLFFTSNDKE